MEKHLAMLGWNEIVKQLSGYALCEAARERCLQLLPNQDVNVAKQAQKETTAARAVMDFAGSPPLAAMEELQKTLRLIDMDAMLMPDTIHSIDTFLVTCRRMKGYLQKAQGSGATVAYYGANIVPLPQLEDEISQCIQNGQVSDNASDKLRNLRRRIDIVHDSVKDKLNALLKKNPKWFSECFVSIRNGRSTLPVKRENKANVPGQVVELSASGATCFIEPASVRKLTDEMDALMVEEDAEVRRVLYHLTALIASDLGVIRQNIQIMETLDFLFAKAKYAHTLSAHEAVVEQDGTITLIQARHPLLNAQTAVPLDFSVGGEVRGVVITGPNTGGKTVAIKTVGILSLMAQSGLHVPAQQGSAFIMRDRVLCDIGDGQSITENLSTFSSHITGIIGVLKVATSKSLVLLDELGSGTDPQEGMGLAVAILEEMASIGCLFAATTHYPEVKVYAAQKQGLINARMGFDRETLSPLYRLEIGAAGESCALFIAKSLGFPERLLEKAAEAAYPTRGQSGPPISTQECIQHVKGVTVSAESTEKVSPKPAKFRLGDCVQIYPQKELGIVFHCADEKGMIGVIIKRKKQFFNHKRLKLHVPAAELYPEDYDFSTVFDTVAVRKSHKSMTKRHDPNVIIREKESDTPYRTGQSK